MPLERDAPPNEAATIAEPPANAGSAVRPLGAAPRPVFGPSAGGETPSSADTPSSGDRRVASAELERLTNLAAIGEIAAEVAHELRNALQIVSANVFLARQSPSTSEPHLLKIERSARLAHGIVDDLMSLARGEPAHAEPVPFTELVALGRELLPSAGAQFQDIAPVGLVVRAHVGLASRLLHVLYENAIRAALPERARIVTRVERSGERLAIEIADDGPGVPAEIATTLFEPLVTARAGGTGLGLALARRIVAAHRGTIALVPNEAGQTGATFRIELPAG